MAVVALRSVETAKAVMMSHPPPRPRTRTLRPPRSGNENDSESGAVNPAKGEFGVGSEGASTGESSCFEGNSLVGGGKACRGSDLRHFACVRHFRWVGTGFLCVHKRKKQKNCD